MDRRIEEAAKLEGMPLDKAEQFIAIIQNRPYITAAGLQWKAEQQYPDGYTVQVHFVIGEELRDVRMQLGLKDDEPMCIMRGEVWVPGRDKPFIDYGTTSPKNLSGFIKFTHYPVEMAARRASNRALRAAVPTSLTSAEELDMTLPEPEKTEKKRPERERTQTSTNKPVSTKNPVRTKPQESPAHTGEDAKNASWEVDSGLLPGQHDANKDIPFDEFEGSPPPEREEKAERNIPHEIRIAYGRITSGIQTALNVKFTKWQLSDLLGRIMTSLQIPAIDYLGSDGLIHTSPMMQSEQGRKHAKRLLENLNLDGVVHKYKNYAKAMLEEEAKQKQGATDITEIAEEVEEVSKDATKKVSSKDTIDSYRKSISEFQQVLSKEYAVDGVKLGAKILQKCNLGKNGEVTVENVKKANGELSKAYTRILNGEEVKDLLKELGG